MAERGYYYELVYYHEFISQDIEKEEQKCSRLDGVCVNVLQSSNDGYAWTSFHEVTGTGSHSSIY